MDTSHSSRNISGQPVRVDTVDPESAVVGSTPVGSIPAGPLYPEVAPYSPNDLGAFARMTRERDKLVADLDHFSQQYLRLAPQGERTGLPCSYGEMLARQGTLPLTVDQARRELMDLKESIAFLEDNSESFHGEQRQLWLDLKTSYTLRLILLVLPGNIVDPIDHQLIPEPVVNRESDSDSDGEDDSLVIPVYPSDYQKDDCSAEQPTPTVEEQGQPKATGPCMRQVAEITAEHEYELKDHPSLIPAIEQFTDLCAEFNRTRTAPSPALHRQLMLRVTDCIDQSKQARPELLALLVELSVFLRANNCGSTVRFIQNHLARRWFLKHGQLLGFRPCFLVAWLVMDQPADRVKLKRLINLPAVYQKALTPDVIKTVMGCCLGQAVNDFLSQLSTIVSMTQLVESRQINSAELVIKSMASIDSLADQSDQGPLLALCIDYHLVRLIQVILAYGQGSDKDIETLLKLLADRRTAFCAAPYWQRDPPEHAKVWHSAKVILAWAERCAQPLNVRSQVTFPPSINLLHSVLVKDVELLAATIRVTKYPCRFTKPWEQELYLAIALAGMVTTCARAEGLLPGLALGGTDFTGVNRFLEEADFPEQLLPLLMRYSRAFDQYVQRCCQGGFCQQNAPVPVQLPQQVSPEGDGNTQTVVEHRGLVVNYTMLRPNYLTTLKELFYHQAAALFRAGGAETLESLRVALLRLAHLDGQYKPERLMHCLVPEACALNWYGTKVSYCGNELELAALNRKWVEISHSPISVWYLLGYLNDNLTKSIYVGWNRREWDKQLHPESERQRFKREEMIPRFRAIASSINLLINLETPWFLLPALAFLLDNREGVGLFSLLEWLHAPLVDLEPQEPPRPVDLHAQEVLNIIVEDLQVDEAKERKKEPKKPTSVADKGDKAKLPSGEEWLPSPDRQIPDLDKPLFELRKKVSWIEIFSACRRQDRLPSRVKLPAAGLLSAEQCVVELLMASSVDDFKKLVSVLHRSLSHVIQHGAALPYINPAMQVARGCYHSNLIPLMTIIKRIFNRDFSDFSGISHHYYTSGQLALLSIFLHLINQDVHKLRGVLPEHATDPFLDLLKGQLCLLDHQQEARPAIALHHLKEAGRHFHNAIASDYPPARANWAACLVRFPEIVAKYPSGTERPAIMMSARYVLDFVSYEKDRELQVIKLWLDYQEHKQPLTPAQIADIIHSKANSLSHIRSYYRLWSLYRQDKNFLNDEDASSQLVSWVLMAATPMSVLYLLLDIDLPAFKQEAIEWFLDYRGDKSDQFLSSMVLFWPSRKACVARLLDALVPRLAKRLNIAKEHLPPLCARYPDLRFWRQLSYSEDGCSFLLNQLTMSDVPVGGTSGDHKGGFNVAVKLLLLLPRQYWQPGTGYLNRLVSCFHQQWTTNKAVLAELLAAIAFDPAAGCDQLQQTVILAVLMGVFQDKKYFRLAQELLPKTAQCRHLLLVLLVDILKSSSVNVRMAQTLIAIISTLPKGFDRASQRAQQWDLLVSGFQLAISKQLPKLVGAIQELVWTLFQRNVVALETMEQEQRIAYLGLLKQGGQNMLELIDSNSSAEMVEEILALEGAKPDYQRIIPILAQPRPGQSPGLFLDRHFPALLDRCNNMANPDHRAVRGMILASVNSRQLAERVPSIILRQLFLERVSQPSELGTKLLRARLLQQGRPEWQPRELAKESYSSLESTAIYLVKCGSQQELADWLPVYLSAMVEAKRGVSAKKRQAGAVQLHNAMGTIRTTLVERFPKVITAALLTHASKDRPETGQQFAEALLTLTCRCLAADQSDTSPLARSKEKQGLVDLGATIPACCLPVWLTLVGGCPWSKDEMESLLGSLLSHCMQAQEHHPPGSPLALEQPLELVRQLPQYLPSIDLTEILSRTPPLADQARALIRRCEQGRAVAPGVAIQDLLQEADALLMTLGQDQDSSVSDWHALQVRTRLQWHSEGGHGETAAIDLLQEKEEQLRVFLQAGKIHRLLATSRSASPKKIARIVNKWLEQLKKTGMLAKVLAALAEADRDLLHKQYGVAIAEVVAATAVILEPRSQEQQREPSPSPPAPSSPSPPASPPPVTEKESSTESYNRSFWLNLIRQGEPGNGAGLEQFFSEILTLPPSQCLEQKELDELHQWFRDKIHRHFQDKGVFTPLSNLKGAAAYDARCRLVDLVMANDNLEPSLAGLLLAYKAAVLDDKQVFCPKLAVELRRADEQARIACIVDSCRFGCGLYVRFVGIAWPESEWINRALTSACIAFTLPALGTATVPLEQGGMQDVGSPEQMKQLKEHMGLLVSGIDSVGKALLPESVKTALGGQLQSTLVLFQQLEQAHNNLVGIDPLLRATIDSDRGILGAYQRLGTMQEFIRQWQDNKEWWSGTQSLVRDASIGVRRALQVVGRQVASRLDQLRPKAQVIELAGQLSASEKLQWDQILPLLELSGELVGLLLPLLRLNYLGQMDRLLQEKLQTGGKKKPGQVHMVCS